MTYNNNIPQATDDPSQSQGQLLGNFAALDTYTQVDHVPLNDPDQGKHAHSTYPEQASDPVTGANEVALYSKEYTMTVSAVPTTFTNLFFAPEGAGTVGTFGGPSLLATAGYTFIPGGLLVQWNTVSASSGSNVTFPIAFGANPFYVSFMVTGASANNRVYTRISGTPVTTHFAPIILNTSGSGLTNQITYIAIGTAP